MIKNRTYGAPDLGPAKKMSVACGPTARRHGYAFCFIYSSLMTPATWSKRSLLFSVDNVEDAGKRDTGMRIAVTPKQYPGYPSRDEYGATSLLRPLTRPKYTNSASAGVDCV